MPSKSAEYYKKNPEARKKKNEYQKKYNKSSKERKRRGELVQERRKRGIYGKGGKDVSHTKNGGTTLESPSQNRARNGMQKGRSKKVRTNTKK